MSERHTAANAIDERAIAWVCLLDRGNLPSVSRAELDAWLAEDARHRGAFFRAQAAWKSFDRLAILSPDDMGEAPAARFLSRRNLLVAGGSAAALAATAAGAFIWVGQRRILTPLGEIRRVPLSDGSLAAINTDSTLSVTFKDDLREITLYKGEAWFEVAKDRKRPFVVTSGGARVRAVGTAFSVRRRDDGADVLVTEGVVETWVEGEFDRKSVVSAGSKIFVSDKTGPSPVVPVAAAQMKRSLAWREGVIVLQGETLDEAAAEFNRYNERKLVIDPALSDKRLIGRFRTNEPDTFAQAAATTLGAILVDANGQIRLSATP